MDWFLKNFAEIVKQYPDHYLAIANDEIVAAAETPGELRDKIQELKLGRHLVARSHPDAFRNYK